MNITDGKSESKLNENIQHTSMTKGIHPSHNIHPHRTQSEDP